MSQKSIIIIIIAIIIFASAVIISIRKQTFSTPPFTLMGISNTYPFVLRPLPEDQLTKIRSEFEMLHNRVCTQIDEYGFTSYRNNCNEPGIYDKTKIENELEVKKITMDWIIENSKFTGVVKISDIEEQKTEKQGSKLNIIFEPRYENLQIIIKDRRSSPRLMQFTVFANTDGISSIFGHGIPSSIISVPLKPKISKNSAKNSALKKLGSGITIDGIEKVVFINETSKGLEFRLAWAVYLSFNSGGPPSLVRETEQYYIDAITSEEL